MIDGLFSSNRGNIYRVKYQEKLLNNNIETVKDKMACLHLIEVKKELKIENITTLNYEFDCKLPLK